MIRLGLPEEPYWLDKLPNGVRLRVLPLDTPLHEAALMKGRQMTAEIGQNVKAVEKIGGHVKGLPDFDDPVAVAGYSQFLFTVCLAQSAILDWENVADKNGDMIIVSDKAVFELMRMHNVAEAFLAEYTKIHDALISEGKGSGASPNGTSAAAPDTAKAATTMDSPAQKGNGEKTANDAPRSKTRRKRSKAGKPGS